jgi:TolB-like protein/DNA-binding SARP family transcriptional activator
MHSSLPRDCPPRYRLVTLGRLTLLAPDGTEDPSLGTRRRKLAVLAYLALRARPATRDHLAALFWGGKDDARARNSLSDAISHLRRVLGRDALVTRGDDVALAGDAAVVVDAVEFRAAVESQSWTRAIDLYGGAFLDGVHVEDAVDFDRWRAAEEQRLRSQFTRACAPHARALAESLRWDDCAELAARWLDAEPTSAEAALFRLKALAAPKTTEAMTSALAEYERLRTLLADDLGIGMDPAVERLAASIRDELPPVIAAPTPPSASIESPNDRHETTATVAERLNGLEPIAPREGNAIKRPWRRRLRVAAGLAAVTTLTVAIANGMPRLGGDAQPVLAILPFENLGSPADAYFAEGLTDEVRTRLTNLEGVRVISGPSMRRYAHTTKTAREVARELGATYVVTGSVRWEHAPGGEGRVRVSPELVRAADQANMWAEALEGPLDDVFTMQARVAERVASALDATLHLRARAEIVARPTTSLAAYDAYLRGRSAVTSATTFSAADRRVIRAEFERAVMLDPKFAAAHEELGWGYLRDYAQAGDEGSRSLARTKFEEEERRAWELDSTQTGIKLLHARQLELVGDFAGAAHLVREAARAAPGNVDALDALANTEWQEGKYEASLAAHRHAMELDPLASNAWKDLAGDLDRLYRYEEAIRVREREIYVIPNSDVAYAVQASSHVLWRGDTTAARQTLERGSVALPWVVRFPSGVAGIGIWTHALPGAVIRARDTLTLAGYLAGAGGIAPELFHLMKLRHFAQSGRPDLARVHAESLVVRLEPARRNDPDDVWFFGWFSRRSVLAEAYATLGRAADAAREADAYVAENRARGSEPGAHPDQLCHALHNAAYVDVLIGRTSVATARLTEALARPCGHRISRALLRADSAWAPLWRLPAFQRLVTAPTH